MKANDPITDRPHVVSNEVLCVELTRLGEVEESSHAHNMAKQKDSSVTVQDTKFRHRHSL